MDGGGGGAIDSVDNGATVSSSSANSPTVRKFFPETFIWETILPDWLVDSIKYLLICTKEYPHILK